VILAQQLTFGKLFHVVLLPFASYVDLRRYVTDDCFRLLVVSFIHQRLDFENFILVRLYQPIFSTNSSLYLMLRPVLCSGSVATTTSPTLLQSSKVAVMAFRALHGLVPPYLDQLVRFADLPGRRRLRSSSSYQLHVPTYRLATVGRCSFPIAASILWNSLPPDIQSSASLSIFCQRLKTYLFHQSFPDVLLQ